MRGKNGIFDRCTCMMIVLSCDSTLPLLDLQNLFLVCWELTEEEVHSVSSDTCPVRAKN